MYHWNYRTHVHSQKAEGRTELSPVDTAQTNSGCVYMAGCPKLNEALTKFRYRHIVLT